MWWYTLGVLVLWVINPELRRLSDWCFGESPLALFPMLPFLALFPHIWSLTFGGGWQRLSQPLLIAAWAWLGVFSYSLLLAAMNANTLPGSFSFANFVFPISLGLWIAAERTSFDLSFARVTRVLFVLTTVVSIYGIYQYVAAPPWDTLWLQRVIQTGSLSFGRPFPFEIRVFSMLNSPGPFGNFMAVMLLLALPQLSIRRPWQLLQLPFWLIAFGLSMDRSGWLLFAIGAITYLLLAPRRTALLSALGTTAVLLSIAIALLPIVIGNDQFLTTLGERLASLSSLDNDRSANDRQNLYEQNAALMLQSSFGHGLGISGTATKLSDAEATTDLDSGILARLVEMGIPGVLIFCAVFAYLFMALFKTWRAAARRGNEHVGCVASMAISIEVGLLSLEISGDVSGLLLLALWLVIGLALRSEGHVHGFRLNTSHRPSLA